MYISHSVFFTQNVSNFTLYFICYPWRRPILAEQKKLQELHEICVFSPWTIVYRVGRCRFTVKCASAP
jgi:hypothetical protein